MKTLMAMENGWRAWVEANLESGASKEKRFQILDEIAKEVYWLMNVRPNEEYLRHRMAKSQSIGDRMGKIADPVWMYRVAFMEWVLQD